MAESTSRILCRMLKIEKRDGCISTDVEMPSRALKDHFRRDLVKPVRFIENRENNKPGYDCPVNEQSILYNWGILIKKAEKNSP
jgi:hypothetical protein